MKLKRGKETVLVIPDTQFPFHHPDTFKFLAALKKKYKPTRIVHIGDLVDNHALSSYDADPDGMSAGDELRETLKYVRKLERMFPEMDILEGNHDVRIADKAFKAGIPRAYVREYGEFLQTGPGWEWHKRLVVEGIVYQHGNGGPGGMYAAKTASGSNMRSTVMGHLHSNFQIIYTAGFDELIFGMAVGSLIDDSTYAFKYGKLCPKRSIMGTGLVVKGMPILHPMLLKGDNRWDGKL